jgi:hypothetical protein
MKMVSVSNALLDIILLLSLKIVMLPMAKFASQLNA